MLGGLRAEDEGAELTLVGWVHRRRDLGGLVFLDLRDRSGLLQVSIGPDWTEPEALAAASRIGHEDVVSVTGSVVRRPESNPELPTGEVELRAVLVEHLADAETPAIPVYRSPEEELPSEELRLRHRVLDLRRPELQSNLMLRHRLILETRNYMDRLGFVEIETPLLTKPTPEGARDFLVPSRNHPGEFYALPQSPQIYKQILVTAGFDRYFQIARCFRDEDPRADRQPEFTQIDVEASFVAPDDILGWMEGLMVALASVAPGVEAESPFERMSYAEVLDRFGSDRPDLRYALEISDWTASLGSLDSQILRGAVENGGRVRGLLLEGAATLSRKEIEAIEAMSKAAGAPGLLWAKRTEEGGSGPLSRFMTDDSWDRIGMSVGDLVLAAAGPDRVTSPALDAARAAAIERLGLPKVREHAWLWVMDFPVFEENDAGELGANHHPFVMPHPDDADRLESDPLSVRGLAYDLVYNGTELGSGSIRIHDAELQKKAFRVLGLSDEEIELKFGFLLNALRAGAPPHGGVAFGMDRIVQEFTGARSLRDVIAFPKTTTARALFEGAPSAVAAVELEELALEVRVREDPETEE
jgi:aspartyl-tRNA synthetase